MSNSRTIFKDFFDKTCDKKQIEQNIFEAFGFFNYLPKETSQILFYYLKFINSQITDSITNIKGN
jgi:hypothetical protein